MNEPVTAYLGFGSNLGEKMENISEAVRRVSEIGGVELLRTAEYLETEPVGCIDQDDFLNTAAEITTTLDPYELLEHLKRIETEMGRVKEQNWGPRVIDIDILFFGKDIIVTEELIVPHPLVCERIFTLKPVAELNADLLHPVFDRKIGDIYEERKSELSLYHCMEL